MLQHSRVQISSEVWGGVIKLVSKPYLRISTTNFFHLHPNSWKQLIFSRLINFFNEFWKKVTQILHTKCPRIEGRARTVNYIISSYDHTFSNYNYYSKVVITTVIITAAAVVSLTVLWINQKRSPFHPFLASYSHPNLLNALSPSHTDPFSTATTHLCLITSAWSSLAWAGLS